ncbi:unnamed protein product, partial [Urochloa humidicola]
PLQPSPLHSPLSPSFSAVAVAFSSEEHPTPMASRWVRPEVYPLFAAMGVAVGICGFQLFRNITGNPEVRVNKAGRAAGVLENHEEGKRYAMHGLRSFVQDKTPEIMPAINKFFTEPK